MSATFHWTEIRLWNRTKSKASALLEQLQLKLVTFKNQAIKIIIADTVEECVNNADVIVTATFVSEPILQRSWIKANCHINGIYFLVPSNPLFFF